MKEIEKDQTVVERVRLPRRRPKGSQQQRVKLIFAIIEGGELDFGKSYSFAKSTVVIGRGDDCDIVLNDERVSRRHCRVEIQGKEPLVGILLRDMRSTNGTLCNDEAVSEKVLQPGDRLQVGSTVLRISFADDVEEKYHIRLFAMATSDGLTGLYNRRFVLNELANYFRIAQRNRRHFCIMVLDIDHFKGINDQYGHLAGDAYLRFLAAAFKKMLRAQDTLGRFGGEEFLIILPETTAAGALILAERIRQQVAEMQLAFRRNSLRTTISIGIVQYSGQEPGPQELLQMADDALYRAKDDGRNRVVVHQP